MASNDEISISKLYKQVEELHFRLDEIVREIATMKQQGHGGHRTLEVRWVGNDPQARPIGVRP